MHPINLSSWLFALIVLYVNECGDYFRHKINIYPEVVHYIKWAEMAL